MRDSSIRFHKIWIDQCEATEAIRERFGPDNALAPDDTAKRPKCWSSSRGEYPMRLRFAFSLLSAIAFAPHLFAQSETPRYEIFGGYSYSRLATSSVQVGRSTNFHGWNASVTRNINSWFGVVADVSGHYSSESFSEGFFLTNSANLLAYRFGPKFARRGRITPFAQALVGGVRFHREGIDFPGQSGQRAEGTTNGISITAGGGLDIQATDSLALRVVQAEYSFHNVSDTIGQLVGNMRGVRLSFGLVFRFR
jgi:opacity protein-like surface antigen